MDLWVATILKVKAGLLLMDLERGGNGSVGSTRGLKDVNNAVIVVWIYFFLSRQLLCLLNLYRVI